MGVPALLQKALGGPPGKASSGNSNESTGSAPKAEDSSHQNGGGNSWGAWDKSKGAMYTAAARPGTMQSSSWGQKKDEWPQKDDWQKKDEWPKRDDWTKKDEWAKKDDWKKNDSWQKQDDWKNDSGKKSDTTSKPQIDVDEDDSWGNWGGKADAPRANTGPKATSKASMLPVPTSKASMGVATSKAKAFGAPPKIA